MAVRVKDDIWGWYHLMYLTWLLVWRLGSYVDMLLMGWSLWPERARQLEILVDWQPRDQRNLLMCLSRHIYNWFFSSCVSDTDVLTDMLQVCACCCYYQTCYKLGLLNHVPNYSSNENQTSRPWIDFSHSLFSSWPVVITITMEKCFLFVLSSKVLSVICLFIMDREISCLLLKNKCK